MSPYRTSGTVERHVRSDRANLSHSGACLTRQCEPVPVIRMWGTTMSEKFARLGRKVGVVVMSIAIAVVALSAAAQDPTGGPPSRGQGRGAHMGPFRALGPWGMFVSRLGLGDAQMDQIKGILQGREAELQTLTKNASFARQALEAAAFAGEPDATIRQLHANLAAVEADFAVARTHLVAEILQVLTPEQQASLKSMREQMKGWGSQLRQRRQKQAGRKGLAGPS